MLAAALVECAEHVRVLGTIHYDVVDRLVTPYVVGSAADASRVRRGETPLGQPAGRRRSIFSSFEIERSETGVFEYWLIISEILASAAWHVTRLIAEPAEYDDALRRMQSPQIVRAIPPPLLPSAELRDDGTALLDVTVYTRAGEERIERRTLALDEHNEFHFHGRALLAEGRGGVAV
ncbi:MAG TPA: hypothetical protein VG323_07150 [Thermoanaerobaculia bacterium]|nr:hypothetical protein [Thermoanaerobaculia bacterium]